MARCCIRQEGGLLCLELLLLGRSSTDEESRVDGVAECARAIDLGPHVRRLILVQHAESFSHRPAITRPLGGLASMTRPERAVGPGRIRRRDVQAADSGRCINERLDDPGGGESGFWPSSPVIDPGAADPGRVCCLDVD